MATSVMLGLFWGLRTNVTVIGDVDGCYCGNVAVRAGHRSIPVMLLLCFTRMRAIGAGHRSPRPRVCLGGGCRAFRGDPIVTKLGIRTGNIGR